MPAAIVITLFMRLQVVAPLTALLLVGACDASTGQVRPTTATSSESTTSLQTQPAVTEQIVSPAWVPEDYEDPGELIQLVLGGVEQIDLSETMKRVVLESVVTDGALPYLYRASLENGVVAHEYLAVRLGNQDSLSVHYRKGNTSTCGVCVANQVPWDNGWIVWTDAEPARGMIIYRAEHPDLPLNAEIWFFPDPIEWPEALPDSNPILRTSSDDARLIATAILNALKTEVPLPEN